MPGNIRVSVLEAVDLPETFSVLTLFMIVADGSLKGVTARVTLGTRQFETESRVASEGRIDSWNSDFVFLVTNLRDKLVVAICDNDDQCLTQTSIEVPSIIERGFRDEFVELKRGGRIHLNMSFFLTDDERRKIRAMRLHVLKRRGERLQRSIVFQNIQPINENELKTAPVSAVTIADVSDSIAHEQGVSQECVIGPVHFGSTTKSLGPSVMFNYVRAVGMQSGRPCQRTEKSSRYRAAHIVSEASIDGFKIDERLLKAIAVHEAEYGSLKNAIMNSVVVSSRRLQRARLSLAEFIDTASSLVVSPSRQNPPGLVPLGEVHAEVWDTSLAKEHGVPAYDYEGDQYKSEDLRKWNELEDEGTSTANSSNVQSVLSQKHLRDSGVRTGATFVGLENQTQIRDRQQAILAGRILMDVPRSDPSVQSGQVQMLEARSGPGARWPQKSGLDTRWTCREKARQIDRFEWKDQLKARAKILRLIKAASGSRQGCGDDRRLEERQSLKDNIGVVLHKVAGGAAILLVSLLMMWTIPEGSEHGYEGTNEDDAGS